VRRVRLGRFSAVMVGGGVVAMRVVCMFRRCGMVACLICLDRVLVVLGCLRVMHGRLAMMLNCRMFCHIDQSPSSL